jgi:hypothetical protein
LSHPKPAKPATADTVNGLRKIEQQLGGQLLNPENSPAVGELQARRLRRLHALSFDAAITLAPFVFAQVPR